MERESRDLKGGSMRKVILSIVGLAAMVSWDCATERAGANGVIALHWRRRWQHRSLAARPSAGDEASLSSRQFSRKLFRADSAGHATHRTVGSREVSEGRSSLSVSVNLSRYAATSHHHVVTRHKGRAAFPAELVRDH
jgi:hypothetical protein